MDKCTPTTGSGQNQLCPICKKHVNRNNNLNKHVKVHHSLILEKFPCAIRGLKFTHKKNIPAHLVHCGNMSLEDAKNMVKNIEAEHELNEGNMV